LGGSLDNKREKKKREVKKQLDAQSLRQGGKAKRRPINKKKS